MDPVNFIDNTPVAPLNGVTTPPNPSDIKVASIFIRVLRSQFVWTASIVGGSLAVAFAATRLSSNINIGALTIVPFYLVCSALTLSVGAALISVYQKGKELLYEISIWSTVLQNKINPVQNPWHNEIIDGLFLGAQPMLNFNHHEQLPNEGITAILTMVELKHELGASLFTEPVKPQDWAQLNIEQKIIDTPDFLPVPQAKIQAAVDFIHQTLTNGGQIYVHCKAGRGRSATAVICYLLQHGVKNKDGTTQVFQDVAEAIAYVKARRPVISINVKQRAAIETFFDEILIDLE